MAKSSTSPGHAARTVETTRGALNCDQFPPDESGHALLDRILSKRREGVRGTGKYREPQSPRADILPNLPQNWVWATIDQLAEVGTGATPNRSRKDYYEGGKIPWVTSGALNRSFVDAPADLVTEIALRETNLTVYPPGTLLLAMYGEGATRGKCSELRISAATNQAIAAIQCPVEVRNYVKLSLHFQYERLRIAASGGVQPNLNLSIVRSISVPLPPLSDQRRIVAEIEKQFTRLDAGIAALRRTQANLKRYRAAVLKAACEGRLVPTEAELAKQQSGKQGAIPRKRTTPDFESGAMLLERVLNERRKNLRDRGAYKEPVSPNIKDLGPLPEGWTWATFDQIAERVTVGFVGSMKHEYVESGIPFLRGQNVRENRFDPEGLLYISTEFHEKLSKSALRPGDLAVVRSGAVGITCVIPDTLSESNCSDLVLVQGPLGFVPQYGAYYMNSLAKRHVAAGKVGVALTHFNTKSVAALAVPLPPLAEQTRIVAEVERRLSVLEELETVVKANLQRATRLRQSILQQAFSGALTP